MTGFGYNVHGFGAGGDLIITFSISSSTNDFNLLTHITNNFGYDGSSRVTINVTIDADVVIGSTSHTSPAFQTGSIGFATTGSTFNLTNNGTIQGAGGRGGTLASNNGTSTNADGKLDRNGGDGGTALSTTMTTIVDNTNGSLLGGGGGGGAGAVADTVGASGGGGGAGTQGGSGGSGNGSEGQSGSSGNASSGGSGGSHASGNSGGNGGGIGSAGSNGSGSGAFAVGTGGSAGKYLVGNSNTTFTANGTRTGDVS
jgi:hypothetical protein